MSRWLVGSSKSSRSGLLRSALARAILARCPPDKVLTCLLYISESILRPASTERAWRSIAYPPASSNFVLSKSYSSASASNSCWPASAILCSISRSFTSISYTSSKTDITWLKTVLWLVKSEIWLK